MIGHNWVLVGDIDDTYSSGTKFGLFLYVSLSADDRSIERNCGIYKSMRFFLGIGHLNEVGSNNGDKGLFLFQLEIK